MAAHLAAAVRQVVKDTALLPTYTDYPNQVVPVRYDLEAREVQPPR